MAVRRARSTSRLSATVWLLWAEGQRQKPSWCLAVSMMPPMPAWLATSTHWRQSRALGANTSAASSPLPHSAPVNVLGPKWQNMFISMRCHASCASVGTGP